METLHPMIEKMMASGFNGWDAIVATDWPDLSAAPCPCDSADSAATALAMASVYLDRRRRGYTHDAAMADAHKRAKAVRKAMGYTYP